MTERLRVQRERDFSPHHVLLGAAYTALKDAEAKRSGYFNYELACITFSALALEALGDAFGEKFIPRWEDFQKCQPYCQVTARDPQSLDCVRREVRIFRETFTHCAEQIRQLIAHLKKELLNGTFNEARRRFHMSEISIPEQRQGD
jgi:hypothetical protein